MRWLSEWLQFFRWLSGKKQPVAESTVNINGSGVLAGSRLPPRSRVELDASARQRQKLANFGEHDYANLPALGREQAQFLIHKLEAAASQQEDDAQLAEAHRFVSNFVTLACLTVLAIIGVMILRDRPGRLASQSAPAAAEETMSFEQAVAASKARAIQQHPALGVAGSRLNAAFVTRFREWNLQRRPELTRSDWPERLAEQCDR